MNARCLAASLLVIAALFLSACITTSVKGYSDPEFQSHKLRKVMVRAPNVDFSFGAMLETSMVNELKRVGIPAQSFLQTFPPTRVWTNDEVSKSLLATGFDSIMYINLIGSESSTQIIGYVNNGSAHTYGAATTYGTASIYGDQASYTGNASYSGKTSYTGTTTAIRSFERYTSTQVRVFDTRTARTIWIGDAHTKAGGAFFMGDETTSDDIAKEIVAALKEEHHI